MRREVEAPTKSGRTVTVFADGDFKEYRIWNKAGPGYLLVKDWVAEEFGFEVDGNTCQSQDLNLLMEQLYLEEGEEIDFSEESWQKRLLPERETLFSTQDTRKLTADEELEEPVLLQKPKAEAPGDGSTDMPVDIGGLLRVAGFELVRTVDGKPRLATKEGDDWIPYSSEIQETARAATSELAKKLLVGPGSGGSESKVGWVVSVTVRLATYGLAAAGGYYVLAQGGVL